MADRPKKQTDSYSYMEDTDESMLIVLRKAIQHNVCVLVMMHTQTL